MPGEAQESRQGIRARATENGTGVHVGGGNLQDPRPRAPWQIRGVGPMMRFGRIDGVMMGRRQDHRDTDPVGVIGYVVRATPRLSGSPWNSYQAPFHPLRYRPW